MANPADAAPPSEDERRTAAQAARKDAKRERRQLMLKSPAFMFGSFVLAFWLLCALFPGLLTRYDPLEILEFRLGPEGDYWLGTDGNGRDVYSRIIAGARPIMVDSAVAAAVAVTLGSLLGLVMGYLRGRVDEVISRLVEAFLSLPVILIALLATANIGESRVVITSIVAVLFTPIVARTVRAAVLAEAQLDYVAAARLRGESSLFIMVREILPNVTGTIVVELTVRFAYAIFTLATLAFLGFAGGDLAAPGWGKDIATEFADLRNDRWWASIFPAIAIATLVVAVNLIADTIDKINKS